MAVEFGWINRRKKISVPNVRSNVFFLGLKSQLLILSSDGLGYPESTREMD